MFRMTFFALLISTSTSKKVPRSWNPNNITSWDGWHLFCNSTSLINGSKIGAEHWFLAQIAKSIQLFMALWILTSTSKKDPRSWNPTNITSWDGCHLFSNSTSPIKGSKNHAEDWILAQMAKSLQLFCGLWILTSTSKKVSRSWNPTNITSWDGFHLFSNSTSPIKGSKSHAEHVWADNGLKWLKMTQNDPKNHQKLVFGKKLIKI